jgi:hypothetical protein
MPGTALNAAQLLDVDVNQLPGPLALIALGRFQSQAPEPAHPDPGQDARDRRARSLEQLGDLGPTEPQPAQRGDRLDGVLAGAISDPLGSRGAIEQAELALGAVARDPLRARPHAHFGGRGRRSERPLVLDHPQHHPLALSQ